MTVSDKFIKFVQAVHEEDIEFPNLKIAIIAQAILESGRGSSLLFTTYNNPFGMHYHDFMSKYGAGVNYATKTEPNGTGLFASFPRFENTIKAYFAWFDHWSHYGDWRLLAKKTATDFLAHIGPHYCPSGYGKEWIDKHGGLNYHQYIMQNLYDEAEALLNNTGVRLAIKRVGLNAGHAGSAGAQGKNPSIREEFFTDFQSKEIKRILAEKAPSIKCDIINQNKVGGLANVGRAAKDYDIFISLHFNAADRQEHGTEWLGGADKTKTTEFAKVLCKRIAAEFGYKYRGFNRREVTVTKEMDKTNCPIAFLLEGEFIDDEQNVASFTADVKRQSLIIADSIIAELYS